jgi:hypothetical protein
MALQRKPRWWPGVWWYWGPFTTLRANLLPWMGSDGNDTWCRQTIVVPLVGVGAIVIGLRWHLLSECMAKAGDLE